MLYWDEIIQFAGKYIVSMFEYLNDKSSFVKIVCKHRYVELIIAYINIAIIMTLFLLGYSCKSLE